MFSDHHNKQVESAKRFTDGLGERFFDNDDEQLPQQENIYNAPVRAAGSVVNPETGNPLRYEPVPDPIHVKDAFSGNPNSPTYGYYKSGNEWQRVVFDPNYKMGGYQGAYLRIRPYQTKVGRSTDLPFDIIRNEFNKVSQQTLDVILNHVNALYNGLPELTEPQLDKKNRPVLTIYAGEYLGTASEQAQARNDAVQILTYLQRFFPSDQINVVIGTDSLYGNTLNGMISVPVGSVVFEFTIQMNNYGN